MVERALRPLVVDPSDAASRSEELFVVDSVGATPEDEDENEPGVLEDYEPARLFREHVIDVRGYDCDVTLRFGNGKEVVVQCRPSNADGDYPGSLDIILPEDQCVTCWRGDDMQPAPQFQRGRRAHERIAKQLVMCLPV